MNYKWTCRTVVSFLLLSAMVDATAMAQDGHSLIARLSSASSESALELPNLKPWHLTLAVQEFNDFGQPADNGTVDIWWNGESSRLVYATGHYRATEIRGQGGNFRTKGSGTPPYYLELLVRQAINPMALPDDLNAVSPVRKPLTFGKVQLDCIMLARRISNMAKPPLGIFPTLCFDPGGNTLRVSLEFGDLTILRNKNGTFQGKTVATDVSARLGELRVASSQVTLLKTEDIPENTFLPDETLALVPTRLNIQPSEVKAVSLPTPVYPPTSASGDVTLSASLGTDGRIHGLQLVSTPDPLLAGAAIEAARKYVFEPYLYGGQPTEINMKIVIKFSR